MCKNSHITNSRRTTVQLAPKAIPKLTNSESKTRNIHCTTTTQQHNGVKAEGNNQSLLIHFALLLSIFGGPERRPSSAPCQYGFSPLLDALPGNTANTKGQHVNESFQAWKFDSTSICVTIPRIWGSKY